MKQPLEYYMIGGLEYIESQALIMQKRCKG